MLGAYRFYLAMLVVAQHAGGAWGIGGFAVFGFFALSGYLMTYVMHKTYGFSARGIGMYLTNRFLRIYPLYWLCCIFSVLVILVVSDTIFEKLAGGMGIPRSYDVLLANLAITISPSTRPVMITPAWTLSVELFFYLMIGLSISRSFLATTIWLICSIAYTAAVNVMQLGGDFTYYAFAAASLPFSIGAMIFHLRGAIEKLPISLASPHVCFLLSMLQIITWLLSRTAGKEFDYTIFLYISLVINSLTIVSLIRMKPNRILSLKLDALLGKLSYPIYLIHVPITVFIAELFSFPKHQSPLLLIFVILPVLAVSWVLTLVIEEPIEKIRMRVKKTPRNMAASSPAGTS